MNTIWKFPLEITDKQTIVMPAGAQPLSVQVQNGAPYVWAQVNDSAGERDITFFVQATGAPYNRPLRMSVNFLGTIQMNEGALVFHVFYERILRDSTY